MPDLNDYYVYKSTSSDSGSSGGGKGNGFGCGGWAVIVIVAVLLIYSIADGASWDSIDSLLGLGLLAFMFFRWLFS